MNRGWMGMFLVGALAACSGGDPRHTSEPVVWQEIVFQVEPRPAPVSAGMHEFLVMATERSGLPAADLLVSLRLDPQGRWWQAIQDGHSGVYRKALRVGSQRSLYLLVQRDDLRAELEVALPRAD